MMPQQLKVLVFDIETAPIQAYVWGLKDQNIGLNQIIKDWEVLAWGAKWLGEPASAVKYYDKRHDKTDERILRILWKLLDEADLVVTQNGQQFDSPKLNARFISYGMNPPSPYKHLDTYQIVRRVAQFTSNKLEYLTDKLCNKYKKLSHNKFPGMSLWDECLHGNKEAWAEMKKYNIHDVLSTEELYMKIRAWAPKTMPGVYISDGKFRTCTVCGSRNVEKRGKRFAFKSWYESWHCLSCGRWITGPQVKEDKCLKKAA